MSAGEGQGKADKSLRVTPLRKGETKPDGQPYEWGCLPLGLGGFGNPRIGTVSVHALLERESERGLIRYDQQVTVEGLGVITVIMKDGKVALVHHDRPVGPRLPDLDQKNYASEIFRDEETLAREFANLGGKSWEVPRGYAKPLAEALNREKERAAAESRVFDQDLLRITIEAATREALEETGLIVWDARVIGIGIIPNTTFVAHAQPVVVVNVIGSSEPELEDREFIGGMRFFLPKEVRQLVDIGQLFCGFSLAALAIAGFHF